MIDSLLSARPHFLKLYNSCASVPPLPTAVVCPESPEALQGAIDARDANLILPILVGDPKRITDTATQCNLDLSDLQLIPADDESSAAHKGVDLVHAGTAKVLMKGHIHSDTYLSAVIRRTDGLRLQSRTSHCFVVDIPNWDRPIIITDAALNIAPDVANKIAITQNAIGLAHSLSISSPNVALLSATEVPTPSMPSSMDAQAVVDAASRGEITGGTIDGPFALDNAASITAARIKGIESSVAGNTDIYVVPGIDAGNIFFKSLTFMGGGLSAGLVVGAKAPVILTSRADDSASRLCSCILAVLYSSYLYS